MKILFIHPPWPGPGYGLRSQNRWPRKRGDKTNRYPVLLCYAATLLKKKGHPVKYIDSVYQDLDYAATLKEIKSYNPDVIFFETSTSTFNYDVHLVSRIKKDLPNVTIIVGGSHVTKFPLKSLNESEIDIIVKGEMDFTLLETVNALEKQKDLHGILGICFRDKSGNAFNNPKRPLIKDLDSLPFPDRNLIPHQWYIEGHAIKKPFTFVMSARGCPNRCTFCLWPNVYYDHKVRFRTPRNVVDELEWLRKKYGIKEVFFDEGTFNTSEKRAIDISKEIVRRKVKMIWSCSGRVDRVSKEMLKWMKRSGCKMICYGAESANPKTLKRTNKGITVDQIKRAFKLTKEAGIITHANFMLGFPWETKEDMKRTVKLALESNPDTVQFSLVFPHPGSEMYDQAVKNGWFRKGVIGNWEMFDMTHGPVLKTKVPRDELMRAVSRYHARFFFRPTYIIRQLLSIRTKEDFKRVFKGAASVIKGKILFGMKNKPIESGECED